MGVSDRHAEFLATRAVAARSLWVSIPCLSSIDEPEAGGQENVAQCLADVHESILRRAHHLVAYHTPESARAFKLGEEKFSAWKKEARALYDKVGRGHKPTAELVKAASYQRYWTGQFGNKDAVLAFLAVDTPLLTAVLRRCSDPSILENASVVIGSAAHRRAKTAIGDDESQIVMALVPGTSKFLGIYASGATMSKCVSIALAECAMSEVFLRLWGGSPGVDG
jgi:hypothetical protein